MISAALTLPQKRVFEFVQARSRNGENPPTYREICKGLGYRSPKAAADHVAALEKKGYLSRQKGRARSLRIAQDATGVPLLGRVIAGYPESAIEASESRVPVDPAAFGISDRSRAFALRVVGDSMVGRQIVEGDIVLLEKESVARDGDIVAALIDNESTLKTLVRQGSKAWLKAENPLYPSLVPVMEMAIQGVVRGVIRLVNA